MRREAARGGYEEVAVHTAVEVAASADGSLRVVTRGDVDALSVPEVAAAWSGVRADASIVLDLTPVGFIDSSGLGAVVALHRRAVEAGGTVRIECGPRTRRLLEITGLDQVMDVTTVEAAGA